MRFLTVFVFAALGLIQAEPYSYTRYKVYEITPENEQQLDLIASLKKVYELDFWSLSRLINHPATVMVEPSKQTLITNILDENEVKYTVLIENLETVFEKERESQMFNSFKRNNREDIAFDTYYRHDEINKYLDRLAIQYPKLVTVEEIGKSYEGRSMKTLKISNGGNGAKPLIFIDAAIHAREWATPAFALYIINQLVENTANNLDLLNVDWLILPVVNPDGYEYTHTNHRMWRKTRSNTTNPNCKGVDANRNYDHFWMHEGGSSDICGETYSGPSAFSEVEARTVGDLLLSNKGKISMYISLHTYGNWLLYPWAYTKTLPENVDLLESLAHNVSNTVTAATGTRYTIGSTANVMYFAAGVSVDYAAGEAGIGLSYTWELPGGGSQGFDLPPEDLEDVCKETFIGLRVFVQYVYSNMS